MREDEDQGGGGGKGDNKDIVGHAAEVWMVIAKLQFTSETLVT